MPTVITHAAVPLCFGAGLGLKVIPPRLLFAGVVLAMLPDADVLAFKFGVAYSSVWPSRIYPLFTFRIRPPPVVRTRGTTMVSSWAGALLAVFNRFIVVAQPAGFDNHGWERRWLAVAVVR